MLLLLRGFDVDQFDIFTFSVTVLFLTSVVSMIVFNLLAFLLGGLRYVYLGMNRAYLSVIKKWGSLLAWE